jgi:peroxin-10
MRQRLARRVVTAPSFGPYWPASARPHDPRPGRHAGTVSQLSCTRLRHTSISPLGSTLCRSLPGWVHLASASDHPVPLLRQVMSAPQSPPQAAPSIPPHGFTYPYAAAPDIIRANQKDQYFTGVLQEQLSSIVRQIFGARVAHGKSAELATAASLVYLGLTTFVGNRTLGEEYCDIVQVENDSNGPGRLPSLRRRGGYILTTILLPYWLNRGLPALRRRLRQQLEKGLKKDATRPKGEKPSSLQAVRAYLLANLDSLTSPSPVYAVSLAIFYFSGAYYHLGKRLWGLRYIFTREVQASEQRAGYEVLGVLLVLQLGVQAYLHAQQTLQEKSSADARASASASHESDHVDVSLDPNSYSSNNALLFNAESHPNADETAQRLQKMTHTPVLDQPRYDLADSELMGWISSSQQRKCTLCLEEMKDPSVTLCGHIFCWTCIGDWCREKPECPLCRQPNQVQRILPLRA